MVAMLNNFWFRAVVITLAGVFIASCSSDPSGPQEETHKTISFINSDGGEMTSTDKRLKLTVPPGAVAGALITLEKISAEELPEPFASANPTVGYRITSDQPWKMDASIRIDAVPPDFDPWAALRSVELFPRFAVRADGDNLLLLDEHRFALDIAQSDAAVIADVNVEPKGGSYSIMFALLKETYGVSVGVDQMTTRMYESNDFTPAVTVSTEPDSPFGTLAVEYADEVGTDGAIVYAGDAVTSFDGNLVPETEQSLVFETAPYSCGQPCDGETCGGYTAAVHFVSDGIQRPPFQWDDFTVAWKRSLDCIAEGRETHSARLFVAFDANDQVGSYQIDIDWQGNVPSVTSKEVYPEPQGISTGPLRFASCNDVVVMTNKYGNSVVSYSYDHSTGLLTAGPGSPYQTNGNPLMPVFDPTGEFLYVGIENTNVLVVYDVDIPTGGLTELPGSPFTASGYSYGMMMDPAGKHVYGIDEFQKLIVGFAIDETTGAVTELPDSPFPSNGGRLGAIDPSGNYLYTGGPNLSRYVINRETGALTDRVDTETSSRPFDIEMHPLTNVLYATTILEGNVMVFDVDPETGLPTEREPVKAGTRAFIMTMSPLADVLMVSNGGSNNISVFAVGSVSGNLSEMVGSTLNLSDREPFGIQLMLR